MQMVSIKDMYLSAAGDLDVRNREFGAISSLLPATHKEAWHRINTEMALSRLNYQAEVTSDLLYEGFTETLKAQRHISNQLDSTNHYLSECNNSILLLGNAVESGLEKLDIKISEISSRITTQNKILVNTLDVLIEISKAINSPRATEACELTRRVEKNFCLMKDANETQGRGLIDESKSLVAEALALDSHNWHAHYNAGWISYFFDGDFDKAVNHFDTASFRAIQDDKKFSGFALRAKAEALSKAGRNDFAVETLVESIVLSHDPSPRIWVDLSRYYYLDSRIDEAIKIILALLIIDTGNLILILSDSDLGSSEAIREAVGKASINIKEELAALLEDCSCGTVNETSKINDSVGRFNVICDHVPNIFQSAADSDGKSIIDKIEAEVFPNKKYWQKCISNEFLNSQKKVIDQYNKYTYELQGLSSVLDSVENGVGSTINIDLAPASNYRVGAQSTDGFKIIYKSIERKTLELQEVQSKIKQLEKAINSASDNYFLHSYSGRALLTRLLLALFGRKRKYQENMSLFVNSGLIYILDQYGKKNMLGASGLKRHFAQSGLKDLKNIVAFL